MPGCHSPSCHSKRVNRSPERSEGEVEGRILGILRLRLRMAGRKCRLKMTKYKVAKHS